MKEKRTHVGRATDRDDYETPPELWRVVSDTYEFTVDCAASAHNALCPKFFSEKNSFIEATINDIALARCWLNPPFSQKEEFLKRVSILRDVTSLICVITPNNARETTWWRSYALQADLIINLAPRVNYCLNGVEQSGVPFSSCLLLYYPRLPGASYGLPTEHYWEWKK